MSIPARTCRIDPLVKGRRRQLAQGRRRAFTTRSYDAPQGRRRAESGESISEALVSQVGHAAERRIELVYTRSDDPDWFVGGAVSDDGRYLVIQANHGDEVQNTLLVQDLAQPARADPAHHSQADRRLQLHRQYRLDGCLS